MENFDKIEFGNKLRAVRLQRELSLENVGKIIGKNGTTVGRYERGEIIPDAEVLKKLCDALDIYNGDLYKSEQTSIINIENSKNPFKTKRLYLYYKGFISRKKLGKFKLIIDLIEKKDFIEVRISSYKTKKTILIGYTKADDYMVVISTENFKANYPRLEANQIILNISGGIGDTVKGIMMCTNGEYIPNIKKCLVSKKDLTFTDEMLKLITFTEEEKEGIKNNDIWQANINNLEEVEYIE